MKQLLSLLVVAICLSAAAFAQTSAQTPAKIDGTGGARTAKQTRPPDNRRPRGTAVGLLGWRAGIRSDAFGAIPFLDAAARIDAAGVAFIEAVYVNLDYKSSADEIANIKARLTDLGLRVPAYRIDAIPADELSRAKLLEFVKALEIDLILTRQAFDSASGLAQGRPFDSASGLAQGRPASLSGVNIAVEDARGMYKQGETVLGANLRDA